MATYTSVYTQASAPKSVPHHGLAENLKVLSATVTTTAAPTTADTLSFFTIPKNAKIHGFKLMATRMDTNGSPTLSWNVGDAGSATRLFSASTVGRVATPVWVTETDSTATYTGMAYQYTADTLITAVPQANAATGVAGSVTLVVYYTLEGGAS
jgi:hypothetical protein